MARGAGLDFVHRRVRLRWGPAPVSPPRTLDAGAAVAKEEPSPVLEPSILPPQPGPRTMSAGRRRPPPHPVGPASGSPAGTPPQRRRPHCAASECASSALPFDAAADPTPCTAELLLEIAKRITHERDSPLGLPRPTRYEPVAPLLLCATERRHRG